MCCPRISATIEVVSKLPSDGQFIKQRVCLLQIGWIEAFVEPAVHNVPPRSCRRIDRMTVLREFLATKLAWRSTSRRHAPLLLMSEPRQSSAAHRVQHPPRIQERLDNCARSP